MDSPRHPEPSDADLVRAAQAGDRDALDQLVTRHGRRVLSVARGVTRHREDAEDVAQEVFVRLMRTIGRVDPERPIEAWLVQLTLNAARSACSRSPRRREDGLEAAGAGLAAPPDQGRAVEEAQFRAALTDASQVLGEREREVFLLRDVEGLEVSVIAEVFHVAEVTIRRQSSDARRKVIEWFRAHRPELL
jgi:RNA polymerase sigma-70 factor, ECF subfamily